MWKTVDRLKKEWPMIKQVPYTFFSTLFILVFLSFLGINWIYSKSNQAQNAVIEAQKSQLNLYQDARLMSKIIIFNGNGEVLFNPWSSFIDSISIKKTGQWDKISIELKTKGHLQYVPYIQTLTDAFWLKWTSKRTKDNIIEWQGHYSSYNEDIIPQFKMEIYHEN